MKRVAFVVSLLLCLLSWPLTAAAQETNPDIAKLLDSLQTRFNLSEEQVTQLRPLVGRQLQSLQTSLAKYHTTKAASPASLWSELQASRREFEEQLKQVLTDTQRAALRAARAELQQTLLSRFRNEQALRLKQHLGLDEAQAFYLHAMLADDFAAKLVLLEKYQGRGDEAATDFAQELDAIARDTDLRVKALLTPQQRDQYRALEPELARARLQLWSALPTVGEPPRAWQINQEKQSGAQASKSAAHAKRGEFIIAPIPMINPTLENGLGLVVGYLYRLDQKDKVSPPSASGLAGFRTSNGSWAIGFAQLLHLKEDRYRITVAGGYLNVNYNFFGIGSAAGSAGISIPLDQNGYGGIAEGLYRIGGHWYVGARYFLMRSGVGIESGEAASPDGPTIPPIDIKLRTASLGPRVQHDTRSDQFYPRKGSLFDINTGFYGRAVGGQRTYQSYQVSYNKYVGLGARQVLAIHGTGCAVAGNAPFYDVCLLGQSKDLRGYEAGRYRDRLMLATQAEYRLEVWKRIGIVAFGGVGEVAPKFNDFNFDKLLPGGGAGLRFRLTKQNHVNLRVDYAWGKGSNAFYVSVGEAF